MDAKLAGKLARNRVGAQIRARRAAAGLTRTALARAAGIPSPSTVHNYETGGAACPPDRLAAIAAALGCPVAELTA